MRVGVNTLFLVPGEVGGSETYVRQVLPALLRADDALDLILFTNRENDPVLRADFQGCRRVSFSKLDFRATNRYMRIIREQVELPFRVRAAAPDVLWSPGYTCPCFPGCPQVTSLLDMQFKSHPEDLSFLARATTSALVNMAAVRSRRIISISEFSKREVLRYTTARADRIDVTPLGVDRAFAEVDPARSGADAIKALTGADRPYILAVSNTYPHKNLHAVVHAFGELRDEVPHQLVLVGRPRLGEPALQAAIQSLGDSTRLTRLEYVEDRRDLVALYQRADLFVYPSLYEGFGLPVLEAMMAGVPVVASAMGSIPEVGGGDVVYVDHTVKGDLARKIAGVLAWSPARRDAWACRARQRAGALKWRHTGQLTIAALRAAAVGMTDRE